MPDNPQLRGGLGFATDPNRAHPKRNYPGWIDEISNPQTDDPGVREFAAERQRFSPQNTQGGGTGPWGDPNQARDIALDAYRLGFDAKRSGRDLGEEFRKRYAPYGTGAFGRLLWRAYNDGRGGPAPA